MKKIILLVLVPLSFHSFAQSEKEETVEKKGFKKEKLFTGGSVTGGFSNYATILGITPQFGYSLTDWADAGITFNLNYTSQRDYEEYGDKLRQTVYGPGAFVRLFPVRFLSRWRPCSSGFTIRCLNRAGLFRWVHARIRVECMTFTAWCRV